MLEDWSYQDIESGRSETLVKALDKIEILEKKLEIAMSFLDDIVNTKKYYDGVDIRWLTQNVTERIKDVERNSE